MHKKMKWALRIVLGLVAVLLLGVGVAAVAVLSQPKIQRYLMNEALDGVTDALDARLELDSLGLDMMKGRAFLYGMELYDLSDTLMLQVDTLEVTFNPFQMMRKRLVVEELDLRGVLANLYKVKADSAANYQFVVDALTPDSIRPKKIKKEKDNGFVLNVDKAALSRVSARWNVWDAPHRGKDTLDLNHLDMQDLQVTLLYHKVEKNNYYAELYNLYLHELNSGFRISLENMEHRIVNRNSLIFHLQNLNTTYQDKFLHIGEISINQDRPLLDRSHDMNIQVDSLTFKSNNGKLRKNEGKPNHGWFDTGHLNTVINSKIVLHKQNKDTLRATIQHMSMRDLDSGLCVDSIRGDVESLNKVWMVSGLMLHMPYGTRLTFPSATLNLQEKGKVQLNAPLHGTIMLQDIGRPFAPVLSNFTLPLHLETTVTGGTDKFFFNRIHIRGDGVDIQAEGNLCDVTRKEALTLHFDVSQAWFQNERKMELIKFFMKKQNVKMEEEVKRIGDVTYKGEFEIYHQHEKFKGKLNTTMGIVNFDFILDNKDHLMHGKLSSKNLSVGKLFQVDNLGPVNGHAKFVFNLSKEPLPGHKKGYGKLPRGEVSAQIDKVRYKLFTFNNVKVDMESDGELASGWVNFHFAFVHMHGWFDYTYTVDGRKIKLGLAKRKQREEDLKN